ncbi:MAG: hypothetical protein CL944_02640 [Candidatus Diapherotrites archaeon]|uniref:Uncharacterized protein n=1 Tax=Candidatus Iainarchaeum sp. TaxID=3101447 RepID=A0A2D6LQ92_9ARCH|nr:hypothetical protein [Candidatus Diapherotrites archaeon]|tara:strand:- start:1440 stop:1721 length:282 start_codon:yes stop_codon:yes gene_type:complete
MLKKIQGKTQTKWILEIVREKPIPIHRIAKQLNKLGFENASPSSVSAIISRMEKRGISIPELPKKKRKRTISRAKKQGMPLGTKMKTQFITAL